MVCEHPQTYHQLISNKKMLKSLHKKNYTHIFSLNLDLNSRTCKILHIDRLVLQLPRLRSWLLDLTIIMGLIQGNLFSQNFKPLSQESTTSYAKTTDIYVQYYMQPTTYLRGKPRKFKIMEKRPLPNRIAKQTGIFRGQNIFFYIMKKIS